MIIIDKTKPPAPILEHTLKPNFKNDTERQRYWEKEKQKWLEGYLDVPPTLYHKTQEQWIKDRITGDIFRPTCRDVDLLIHQEITDCIKHGEALVVIKGRGVGLSTDFGCLANYFMKVHVGSNTLMTSQENAKIRTLFEDKVLVTYDKYDKEIRPVEISRTTNKGNCGLTVEQLYKNKEGELELNQSKIICRETSDSVSSASAFSGTGAIFGCMDELFLHKRRKELVRSSTSCYVNPKTKKVTGFLFAGGTVEDTLDNAQLFDLQKMITEIRDKKMLETMPARLLFIPAWYGFNTVNGWSDEKGGREWWEKEIERLEKLNDPDALRAFRMNNPMSLEDIFELTSGARFSDTISDKIKIHIKTVKNENPPILACRLVDTGIGAETIQAKKPNVWILENPKQGVEYLQLIDGVGIGKKEGGERGSKIASMILKLFDPDGGSYSPVCIYHEKPDVVPDSYPHLVAQLKYYNKFGKLKGSTWEHNQAQTDHWGTYMKSAGFEKYILKRRDHSGKGNIDEHKMGQTITIDSRKYQYREANDFLAKYLQNIKMLMLLEEMLLPVEDNADILDAWLLLFLAVNWRDFDKPIKPKVTMRQRQVLRKYRDPQGKILEKWVTL